ncbi:MAG TPA: LamG domain-containing protein [Phycisphaerae bacterium]|nr:LamG domain-containing protein [Phycisphaerae bacterium]
MKSESKTSGGRRKLVCGQAVLGVAMVLSLFSYAAPMARAVDCNTNGIEDACDIDCGTPGGACDVAGCGLSEDCNTNGVPDECDPPPSDCNSNGIPDSCDLAGTNNSLSFDGINDVVRVPRSAGLEPASEFTIELWIRPAGVGPQSSRIFRTTNSFGYILAWQQGNDRRLQLRLDQPQGGLILKDNVNTSTYIGQWMHVAAVYSASQNKSWLYVNGVVKAQGGSVGTLSYSNGDLQIGNWNPLVNNDEGFPGQIDEARLWNVARSGAEINTWMNHSLRGNETGLAGYWRFTEASGQSALDSTAFGNHGTLGETPGADANDPSWQTNGSPVSETDCNNNGVLDTCDLWDLGGPDCNLDLIPDSCQVAGNDCNSNGVPDDCEGDCDADGTSDACEIQAGAADCNSNGLPDICDAVALNTALDFDGANDYVNIGDHAVLNLSNGFTLEAWVRSDSIAGVQRVVSKGISGVNGYGFGQVDGKLTFVTYGIFDYTTSGVYLTAGTWSHIAVVFDGSNDAHFYVNGQFAQSVNGNSAVSAGPNPLNIGRTGPLNAQYWNGAIDEVRIWSVMRTAQELADAHALRLAGTESGLIGYWRLDEGAGQIASDSTANALDGILGSDANSAGDASDPLWTMPGGPIPAGDCNDNGVLDVCDIDSETSNDCNMNDIPDECESQADCNNNSIQDICEPGGDDDCDGDEVTDLCEIDAGAPDCNTNEIPDSCDTLNPNRALNFDGSNDLVRVPHSALLDPANNLTVECWIRPDSVGSYNSRIVRNQSGQGYLLSWRQEGGSRLQLRIDKSTGSLAVTDTVDTNTYFDTWIHVAGVYSATNNFAGLYVNGVLKASTTASGPLLYSNADVAIGNSTAASEGFDGLIDEVRIWNVARTGTQIAANMNRSLIAPQNGLVGYWRFDEGSDQVAADSSGLGQNGILGSTTSADTNDPSWVSPGTGSASAADCDGNDVPDTCDLAGGATDCNTNGVLDACEADCNGNGIADECDLTGGAPDCNSNGSPDACDIANGTSTDVNTDGIPDSCQPDVHVAPVVTLINPSSTTETRTSLPTSASAIVRGGTYYVEIWASDVGTTNTGLTGVYVDLAFCSQSTANAVFHGNTYTVFSSGTISSGLVDEFGGSTVAGGIGNEPQWVRIGWIEMTSGSETASCTLTLQPSASGVAAFGRGDVDWTHVILDSVDFEIQAPLKTYDLTGNGLINVGDFSLFSPSWQLGVPPANTAHDFDCDDIVGVGDLSWFATGWLKNTSDPSILYPPCPQSFAALERATVSTDIDMRLVVRTTPSGSDIAASLPTSVSGVPLGSHYYVELWASDVGDINTGLTSGYVDVGLPPAGTTVANVFHGSTFTLFPTGTAGAGVVDELGGSALPGGTGVQPQWTRVAYVEMVADNTAPTVVYGLAPSATGVAAKARGTIPWDQIALTGATLRQGLRGDIDGDGDVDAVDLDLFVAVLLETSLETSYRIAADFTGDGMANGQDMQGFIPCYIGGGSCP